MLDVLFSSYNDANLSYNPVSNKSLFFYIFSFISNRVCSNVFTYYYILSLSKSYLSISLLIYIFYYYYSSNSTFWDSNFSSYNYRSFYFVYNSSNYF